MKKTWLSLYQKSNELSGTWDIKHFANEMYLKKSVDLWIGVIKFKLGELTHNSVVWCRIKTVYAEQTIHEQS
jgi:hypothetical protein